MQLVIFDLDGVIVSTDIYHYEAWKSIAEENNMLFSYEINHMLRGVSRAESLKIILDVNGVTLQPKKFEEMLDRKNSIYREKLKSLTKDDILTGAIELIGELKENKVKIAIGSSSRNTPLILKNLELSEAFDIVIDGNQIGNSKPHPEVFSKCARGLNIDPTECIVIEDAKAGIDAALNAGMIAVGVGGEDFADAHYMAENLAELSYEKLNAIHKNK